MPTAPKTTPPAAKPATAQTSNAPPAGNSKKMLMIILVSLLLASGGGLAYWLLKPAHPAKPADAAQEALPVVEPKFVELGTFTANLIHEEGDRYLQVAISLKLNNPNLEEKIKASKPEIMHRVNMALQSKRPSELATIVGKEKLAAEIKAQVEYVLGLRKTSPVIGEPQPGAVPDNVAPHSAPAATESSASAPVATENNAIKSGVADVLFTAFIVQ